MTEFRTLREALGWSIQDAMDHLSLARPTAYSYDSGTRQPHRHTLDLMRTWAAPWFPAKHRPQPKKAVA